MNIHPASPHRQRLEAASSHRVNASIRDLAVADVAVVPASPTKKGRISTRGRRRRKSASPYKKSTPVLNSLPSAASRMTLLFQQTLSLTHRRVRFASDTQGRVLAETMGSTKRELTLTEIKQTWWTRLELRKCRERAQDTCRFYMDCRPDYRAAAHRMLDRCGAQKTAAYSKLDDDGAANTIIYNASDDLELLTNAASRGLEKRIINAMNLPFHRHKRSIHSTLEAQQRLRHMDRGFFSSNQQSRLIASQYQQHARYAAVWAKVMASGDAAAAKRHFDDQHQGSNSK